MSNNTNHNCLTSELMSNTTNCMCLTFVWHRDFQVDVKHNDLLCLTSEVMSNSVFACVWHLAGFGGKGQEERRRSSCARRASLESLMSNMCKGMCLTSRLMSNTRKPCVWHLFDIKIFAEGSADVKQHESQLFDIGTDVKHNELHVFDICLTSWFSGWCQTQWFAVFDIRSNVKQCVCMCLTSGRLRGEGAGGEEEVLLCEEGLLGESDVKHV